MSRTTTHRTKTHRTTRPVTFRVPFVLSIALWAAVFGVLGPAPSASAQDVTLEVAEEYPLRGEPTTLRVLQGDQPLEGVEVEVVYRPASQTESSEVLAASGADGRISWTPRDAGVVRLTARRAGGPAEAPALVVDRVSVRFGGFPGQGLAIMALALLLLFGGATVGFVMLLGHEPSGEPPST